MEIEVPRDRSGSFTPLLIAKGQKRFEGFDEKIIARYARGMAVREPERSGDRLPQEARKGEQS
jgi:putative transposase